MNTQKQITVMVLVVFVLLAGCGAYTIYDQPREESALASQQAVLAERGARIFARYCRQCHGNAGEGRIGFQLNREDLRDPNKLTETQLWVEDTITCGRIGKIMPPWAIKEGGALNPEQIRDLVTLITTNAGDGWSKAGEFSAEENKAAPVPSVEDVLKAAAITGGGTTKVCGQLAGTPAPESNTPPAGLNPQAQWTEDATDNKFSVTAISITAGSAATVTFNNKGLASHNFEVHDAAGTVLKDAAGKPISVPVIDGGKNASVTFTISAPGAFTFVCQVHPQDMIGRLFIVDANGATAAATAAPGSAAASGTPSASSTPAR